MPTRKVGFFELDDVANHPAFNLLAATQPINGLGVADWTFDTPSYKMGVIVDRVPSAHQPARLRLLRLRDEDQPHVLNQQRQIRVVHIASNETLTEFTHAVLWNDGYVAAAASRDAPSATYLGSYFSAVCNQACTVHRLYDPEVVARFKQMDKGLRSAEAKIRVRSSRAQQMANDSQLKGFGALFAAGKDADAVTMSVKFSIDRARGAQLDPSVHSMVERLASYDDAVSALVVRGEVNGVVETIDLKQERLSEDIGYAIAATDSTVYGLLESARTRAESRITGGLPNAARMD